MPGANTRDPTHDKVVRRRPDRQGRSGLQEFQKAAPALTLKMTSKKKKKTKQKMISVFLIFAILDHSLISVTQAEGLPRSLSREST